MEPLIDGLQRNPWIWMVGVASFTVSLAAVSLVVRSAKFRRKWLWGLLCLFTVTYGWTPRPGLMITVGLPLGAAYVLWFWRFGRPPSPEALERDAARRRARPAPTASGLAVNLARAAYGLAAASTLLLGWLAASGRIGDLMLNLLATQGGEPPLAFRSALQAIRFFEGGLMAALAGLFLFLAARPYWWGKVLCLWAAVSWGGFGLVGAVFFGAGAQPTLVGVLVAAVGVLTAAVVVQVVDPRFGGSYLRGPAGG